MEEPKYINGISDSVFSKNWEEFCKTHKIIKGESYINGPSRVITLDKCHILRNRDIDNDKNMLPSKEYAEAILALCQLITIKDKEYTKDWKPDWKRNLSVKYCIVSSSNIVRMDTFSVINFILAFPTRELAEKFLNT